MSLSDADHERVVAELGREPTPAEALLFENLWSEHCAYRSSRRLLRAFDSESPAVVVGPGDDAAVVALPAGDDGDGDGDGGGEAVAAGSAGDADDAGGEAGWYLTLGIESHNHPSYVDPYDGAATGVGGIVRDTLSMGAYPVALADSLYFGPFDREHSRYLLEGVVEGIADYGNAIGVPTVAGSVAFHEGYVGNPLVNVACVGLLPSDRLVRAAAGRVGDRLVLVGASTGRDGLGGAAFASEDLAADAETEDRPAVQVGDPYTEKLLVEANEALLDAGVVRAARDLGAAGLGGATTEMVAKGDAGARIDLGAVHLREPGMTAPEILLSESQERMCYAVAPEDVAAVRAVAERFELGCSVVGEVTEGSYVCEFDGETVVDAPAELLAEGAPANDLERAPTPSAPVRDLPTPTPALADAFDAVVGSPATASREWVYRQYDHEVGLRTVVPPGDDAALLSVHEADVGVALAAGAEPNWTGLDAYEGARAVALECATNVASVGARPLAAVDCLNGGNPETPETYGGFARAVDGLADACRELSVPVVGGNVSLYNDSATGPVPPTPTLAVVGTRPLPASPAEVPRAHLSGASGSDLLLVGGGGTALGGSEYLVHHGGTDGFPDLPAPAPAVEAVRRVARDDATRAVHDVATGGLAVALAELLTPEAGLSATVPDHETLFAETPGRVVVETTDPAATRAAAGDVPVETLGRTNADGTLSLAVGDDEVTRSAEAVADLRDVLPRELD